MNELNAKLDELLLRAQAEVADIDLFAPIPLKEDCPVCFLPLPVRDGEICYMACCGNEICSGFMHSSELNGLKELCACCKQPYTVGSHERNARLENRTERHDPQACIELAFRYRRGEIGAVQDSGEQRALELAMKAAKLGSSEAYGFIGYNYRHGIMVTRDFAKCTVFLEVSARKGSISSREILGMLEEKSGNILSAIKHWKGPASAGSQYSLDQLMRTFKNNQLPKEELTEVLLAFQASDDQMKSTARKEAARVSFEVGR